MAYATFFTFFKYDFSCDFSACFKLNETNSMLLCFSNRVISFYTLFKMNNSDYLLVQRIKE